MSSSLFCPHAFHKKKIGSRSLQCNSEGKCQCKPGVTGDKCDRCLANFYNFGSYGCASCECFEAGSFKNNPNCDPVSGTCRCKDNVEGKRCRTLVYIYIAQKKKNTFIKSKTS